MSQGKGSNSRPMRVSPDVYRNSYNRIFRNAPEPPPPYPEVVMLCFACDKEGCDRCNGHGTVKGPDAGV
jgi:hypothetical protein